MGGGPCLSAHTHAVIASPLYQPAIPSALKVFHKQSRGPLYNTPRTLPVTGSLTVFSTSFSHEAGSRHYSRLYILVSTCTRQRRALNLPG